MIINTSTELMKNQKHAVLMAPDKQFEVLQTQEGNALFFSIGTDGVFYVTREIPQDVHGWSKFDLSSALSGSQVKALCFDVAQNIAAGTIDIALAVTVNGQYFLYAALALPNTDAAWNTAFTAGNINFSCLQFDDSSNPSYGSLPIEDVYVSKIGNTKFVVVDILKDAATGVVFRYFVDPTKKIMGNNLAWNPRDPGGNFNAGTIQSALGRKDGSPVDGMYTFGSIGGTPELIYNPLYFIDNKKIAPKVSRLQVDAGSTAMALSANSDNLTDVFVAANGGLWFLDCEDQDDETPLDNVYTHPLFSGVESLHVNNNGTKTIVWALNQQGQIFYMSCAAGSEDDQTAWSYPIVILEQVQGVATYVHSTKEHLVIFANTQDQGLIQLTQDPASSKWTQRNILLPTADYTDIVKDYTFTTHIELADDQHLPLINQQVTISSSSTCSIYINNIYHVLFAQVPLQITSDVTAVITIIQAVDSLAGITFTLTDGTSTVYVNPLQTLIDKLKNVTGDDLSEQVYDEHGTGTQLTTLDSGTRAEIATYIQNFIALNGNLNADGTPVADNSVSAVPISNSTVLGMHFSNGKAVVYNSDAEAATKGVKPILGKAAVPAAGVAATNGVINYDDSIDLGDSVLILAGDGWNWLKKEFGNIERWEIRLIGNINHFIFELAGKIYHFAIRCAHDIAEGIHFILSKIEIAFEQMIQWLGMIFNYKDIKNTHLVLKNIVNVSIDCIIKNVSTLDATVATLFSTIETDISGLLGLPDTDQTYAGNYAGATPPAGSKSPSSNWGTHHLKSNAANADASYIADAEDLIGDLLDTLLQKVQQEGDNFISMGQSFQTLAETAATMPITQVLATIVNIISDFILNTAEDMISTVIGVVESLLNTFKHTLNTPMNIPVLSYLYKEITGYDLTPLDAACFIGAIPVTVIYKLVKGNAPFPYDDPTTDQLINAADDTALRAILIPPVPLGATAGYHVDDGSPMDRATISMNVLALAGAAGVSFITAFKALSTIKGMPNTISDPVVNRLTVLNSALYFLYAAPDILTLVTTIQNTTTDEWYNVMNNMSMILGGAKAIVDSTTPLWPAPDPLLTILSAGEKYGTYIGPGLDLIINLAWQVPTTAILANNLAGRKASVQDANDIVGFIGGTTFDLSGMLSPVLSAASKITGIAQREGSIAATTGAMAYFNMIWGGACVVTSFDGIHTT
jgi:hypothetical protein